MEGKPGTQGTQGTPVKKPTQGTLKFFTKDYKPPASVEDWLVEAAKAGNGAVKQGGVDGSIGGYEAKFQTAFVDCLGAKEPKAMGIVVEVFTAIQESVCGADIAVSWTPPASLQRTVYLQLKVLYADYQQYVDTITQATTKSKPGPKDATKTPKTSKKFFEAAYPTKAAQGTGEYQIVLMDGVISGKPERRAGFLLIDRPDVNNNPGPASVLSIADFEHVMDAPITQTTMDLWKDKPVYLEEVLKRAKPVGSITGWWDAV